MSEWIYTDTRFAPEGAPVGLPAPEMLCITTEWPNWMTEDGVDRPSCSINTWDGEEWDDNDGMVFAWRPFEFPDPAPVPKEVWPKEE